MTTNPLSTASKAPQTTPSKDFPAVAPTQVVGGFDELEDETL